MTTLILNWHYSRRSAPSHRSKQHSAAVGGEMALLFRDLLIWEIFFFSARHRTKDRTKHTCCFSILLKSQRWNDWSVTFVFSPDVITVFCNGFLQVCRIQKFQIRRYKRTVFGTGLVLPLSVSIGVSDRFQIRKRVVLSFFLFLRHIICITDNNPIEKREGVCIFSSGIRPFVYHFFREPLEHFTVVKLMSSGSAVSHRFNRNESREFRGRNWIFTAS